LQYYGYAGADADELEFWGWGEADCTMDDGGELFYGLKILCLFMFYTTEHRGTIYPKTDKNFESLRWENFLIISPVIVSNSDDTKPARFRRLGVGRFEVQLDTKEEWVRRSNREYNNTSWPNSPLMFDGAARETIELV
jgi:hypothetical protein